MAKDFKEFIRLCGMTHVKTSPYYPQSNGKKERWYQTLKRECIRPDTPLSLEDARRVVARYVEHYNQVRLHSALGYVSPADKLAGREQEIFAARDAKLEAARARRKARRAAERPGGIDFAALRREVSMEQVLRHLGHLDALRGSGPQRRGPCPAHGSVARRQPLLLRQPGQERLPLLLPRVRRQGQRPRPLGGGSRTAAG